MRARTLGVMIHSMPKVRSPQQANLIVLGAHGASHFAAVTRAGTVYKVLAFAHCPVIALSPIVLAECGVQAETHRPCEVNFIAGVI